MLLVLRIAFFPPPPRLPVSRAPMTRLHLLRNLRNLRSAIYLLLLVAAVAVIAALWWANHTGLPATWRSAIEREIAKQGIHLTIGSLSYMPFRGIVASEVRVFADAQHAVMLSQLERILIAVDKAKLARGELRLTRIQISDTSLRLPIQPGNADTGILEITGLTGTLLMPGGRLLELRDVHGTVAGVEMTLGARLLKYRDTGAPVQADPNLEARLRLVSQILAELKNWHFAQTHPPALRVFVEGDLLDGASLVARMALQATAVEKNGHLIDAVTAEGNLSGSLVTLSAVHARDAHGSFEGRVDYDMDSRAGRFDGTSSLNMPRLLKSWLGLPALQNITFGGSQALEAEGDFKLDADGVPQVRMTGHARCEAVVVLGVPFELIEGSFCWRDGEAYLRDLRCVRPDGEASGKVMIQGPLVRLALKTTLPVAVYRPFFVGQPLEPVLNDFSARANAAVEVTLEGGFDTTDKDSWALTGSGRLKNHSYRGVPVDSAHCKMSLSSRALDFSDGTVVFNYQDYPLRKAFAGPANGTVHAGRVRYDAASKMVAVEDVVGNIWAAPVLRMFAPTIADSLEAYRFHRPPRLSAAGVIDVTAQGRSALMVGFRSKDPAEYVFLGKNLTLDQATGKVAVRGNTVLVDDLKVTTFEGPVVASIHIVNSQKISGEFSFTDLSMSAINTTYGLNMNAGGTLTGRVQLGFIQDKIETMSGSGLLSVEKSVLFDAPILGPLSPLVAAVVGGHHAGFERARTAFCTFTIKDGILHTNDFHTTTTSLNFAGDGSVDLKNHTLDMTLRVDARGLLGIVTLPLRPFHGLFQFRGRGPLDKPEWSSAAFTQPPPEQSKILSLPPKARPIAPN
ncbi:MAG: AsmA-like C-terminal region-containing protein [Verrucomicrobia bacterium]|nr:MAG: AsmA-like C-terminal region-containing protein [Verrucomicrobiota bacterium]